MDIQNVKTHFLAAYKTSKISILHDHGLYRHVRISGAAYYCFELVTWPGSLAVNCEGDRFSFLRTEDMFEFFRCGGDASELRPNFSYWAEKLSDPRSKTVREFNYHAFTRDVENVMASIASVARVAEIRSDLEHETYECDEHSCREFLSRYSEMEHLVIDGKWEDWTFRYAYACFAIVFGIREYDRAKLTTSPQMLQASYSEARDDGAR